MLFNVWQYMSRHIYFFSHEYKSGHMHSLTKYLQKRPPLLFLLKGLEHRPSGGYSTHDHYISLSSPLCPFLPLKEQRVEKQKPWRCRLRPHAWSLRTYIESSPAHEASDSHTANEGAVQSKACSRFNTTPSTTYHRT